MQAIIDEIKSKMEKAVSGTKKDLSSIRSGRANPGILDGIKVNYYGTPTPINQIASIAVPEPRLLIIAPWDTSQIKEIEKAIQAADIGINPQSDNKVIRIPIPRLSEERRKELVKLAKDRVENGKVSIRNIRRQGNEELKKMEKKSEITEDELKKGENEIQKITDKYIKELENLSSDKEKELMTV